MNKIEILKGTIKSLDRTITRLSRARWDILLIRELTHAREMWRTILLAMETHADDASEVIYDARTDLEAMEIL